MHHNGHICDTRVITGRGSQVTHYHSNVSTYSNKEKLIISLLFSSIVFCFVCLRVCLSLFVQIISEERHSVEFLCFFIRVQQLIWKFLGRNKMKPRRSFSSWDVTHICRRHVSDELSVHSRPNSHFCYHSIATQDCVTLVRLWHPFNHLITSDRLRVI